MLQRTRVVVAFSSLLLANAVTGQDMSDAEIETIQVADTVYMLTGYGGNMGVSAGPDGIILIDDCFALLSDKIRSALAALDAGELELVLNTHWHRDHTDGNHVFGKEVPIIAHHNVRRRLAGDPALGERVAEDWPSHALPVITYGDTIHLHFNGERIELVHFPASHTDGDTVVFFTGSNVVHTGDLLFNGMFPFVDIDAGGDVLTLEMSIARLIARLPADVKIVPGHGPVASMADLKSYRRMLRESIAHVRAAVDEGKGLEAILKDGVPAAWKSWSWTFISEETWLEQVFRSLQAAR